MNETAECRCCCCSAVISFIEPVKSTGQKSLLASFVLQYVNENTIKHFELISVRADTRLVSVLIMEMQHVRIKESHESNISQWITRCYCVNETIYCKECGHVGGNTHNTAGHGGLLRYCKEMRMISYTFTQSTFAPDVSHTRRLRLLMQLSLLRCSALRSLGPSSCSTMTSFIWNIYGM